MPIVNTIYDANSFRQEFVNYNRDYYTYEAYEALFDLFEDTYCDTNWEMDVIAICSEFTEYENIEAYNEDHGTEYESVDELSNDTLVLQGYSSENPDRFVVQVF